jgi:hypothetical protein
MQRPFGERRATGTGDGHDLDNPTHQPVQAPLDREVCVHAATTRPELRMSLAAAAEIHLSETRAVDKRREVIYALTVEGKVPFYIGWNSKESPRTGFPKRAPFDQFSAGN